MSVRSAGNAPLLNAAVHFGATPLAVVSQPQDVSVNAGETASFSALATLEGAAYQWQYSTDGIMWNTLENETTDTLTLTAASNMNGWLCRCAISYGGETINTDDAVLTVYSVPVIQTQPQDAMAFVGDSVSFSVSAVGENLSYQWQYSTDGGMTWVNSSAKKAKTITMTAKSSFSGRLYRCVITDADGVSVTTEAAALTVAPTAAVKTQPKSQIAAAGSTVKFKVTAEGVGLTYQWQLKTPRGEWKDTTAASGKTAALSVVATAGKNAYQYRCVITDAMGNQVITEPALLAVY